MKEIIYQDLSLNRRFLASFCILGSSVWLSWLHIPKCNSFSSIIHDSAMSWEFCNIVMSKLNFWHSHGGIAEVCLPLPWTLLLHLNPKETGNRWFYLGWRSQELSFFGCFCLINQQLDLMNNTGFQSFIHNPQPPMWQWACRLTNVSYFHHLWNTLESHGKLNHRCFPSLLGHPTVHLPVEDCFLHPPVGFSSVDPVLLSDWASTSTSGRWFCSILDLIVRKLFWNSQKEILLLPLI